VIFSGELEKLAKFSFESTVHFYFGCCLRVQVGGVGSNFGACPAFIGGRLVSKGRAVVGKFEVGCAVPKNLATKQFRTPLEKLTG